MGLWSRFFSWRPHSAADAAAEEGDAPPAAEPPKTVELPTDPFVFECQSCGKVFEARRKRPQCPECDSTEVANLSE